MAVLFRHQNHLALPFLGKGSLFCIDVEFFMPWRQKDHYSFSEIADRWHLSLRDITYLAERRKLEVQTWLAHCRKLT